MIELLGGLLWEALKTYRPSARHLLWLLFLLSILI